MCIARFAAPINNYKRENAMKRRSLNLAMAASFTVGGALIPMTLHAAATLEEMVVTARKREENVQDIPISVTAFASDALEKMGVTDFHGLATSNPNVKIVQSGGSPVISSTIAIRGNLQSAGTLQVDPAVGTYIDGHIVAQTIATEGASLDVESVQTLKGPQGTLFGRNTTGGALLIKTVDPDAGKGLSGYIKGEFGELGTENYSAAINLPLAETVALRISGKRSSQDNYETVSQGTITTGPYAGTNIPRVELGYRESEAYRAKLLWNASESTSVLLSLERTTIEGSGVTNLVKQPNKVDYTVPAVNGIFPLLSQKTNNEFNEADSKTYSLTIEHELANGEIKLLAGRREYAGKNQVSLPPLYGGSLQLKPDNSDNHVELQYNASLFDDALDLTSGIFYFNSTNHEIGRTYFYFNPAAGGVNSIASDTDLTVDNESKSLYTQGTYHINDALNVTAGARYTQDDKEASGEVFKSGAMTPLQDFKADNGKFNYLLSVDYSPAQGMMFYASNSTGYRAGGPGVAESATEPGTWGEFDLEEITNYELGAKLDMLDSRLRINMALFKQDYKNYQYTKIIPVPGSAAVVRGLGNADADISGGEIEFTALLPTDITATLTYGYTKAEVKGGSDDGKPLPGIPESNYSVTISKIFSVGPGEIDLLANYYWRDSHFSELASPKQSTVEDLGLLNLSATYTQDQWSVAAFVNNATDEDYYTAITYAGAGAINFTGIGLPRVAGVRGTYNF
ncbi:MAG: TonB-dependent receptor [Spongiibacteraceae bacterium]